LSRSLIVLKNNKTKAGDIKSRRKARPASLKRLGPRRAQGLLKMPVGSAAVPLEIADVLRCRRRARFFSKAPSRFATHVPHYNRRVNSSKGEDLVMAVKDAY
jgi:hypothetical protein